MKPISAVPNSQKAAGTGTCGISISRRTNVPALNSAIPISPSPNLSHVNDWQSGVISKQAPEGDAKPDCQPALM